MAHQIIRQPNELFCIFSTISETFIAENCTKDDLIAFELEEARKNIIAMVDKRIDDINSGRKCHMGLEYEEAVVLSKKR